MAQAVGTSVSAIERTYSHVLTEMTPMKFNENALKMNENVRFAFVPRTPEGSPASAPRFRRKLQPIQFRTGVSAIVVNGRYSATRYNTSTGAIKPKCHQLGTEPTHNKSVVCT